MAAEAIAQTLLVPVWFYSYSAAVYAVSALIALLIAGFSFRLYRMSSAKVSMLMAVSFLSLGLAYAALTATSAYTYFYKPYFTHSLDLGLVNSLGLNAFYILSILAYLLMVLMYLPEKIKSRLFVLYVPFWFADIVSFHLLAIIALAVAAISNIKNFYKKRNLDSFLVMFAFLTLVCFHVFELLAPMDAISYLFANAFLAVGFLSLLIMLVRVSRSGKKK